MKLTLPDHWLRPLGSSEADRLVNGHHAARCVYGGIVVLALLLALDEHNPGPMRSALLVAGTVLGVLAAESFARVLGHEIDVQRPLTRAERGAEIRELVGLVIAAEWPVIFLFLAGLDIIGEALAFRLAVWITIGLLFVYGYLARRLAGETAWRAASSAAVIGGVGLLVALLKSLTH